MVEGHAGLAETALRNLLENAVRHTPTGAEILVSVDAVGVVRVSDDGPGVPATLRHRVFERFSRGDPNGPARVLACRSCVRSWSGMTAPRDWRIPIAGPASSWTSSRGAGATITRRR